MQTSIPNLAQFCFEIPNPGLEIRQIPHPDKPVGDPQEGRVVVIEDDYECEIVRARKSASFWRENVTAVVITSFGGNLLVLRKHCHFEIGNGLDYPLSILITVPTFLVKKITMKLPGYLFFGSTRIKL